MKKEFFATFVVLILVFGGASLKAQKTDKSIDVTSYETEKSCAFLPYLSHGELSMSIKVAASIIIINTDCIYMASV